MTAPAELIEQGVEFTAQNWEWMVGFGSFLVLGAIGLNFRQRETIRQRDDNKCQSTDRRIKCGGRLEVDHIIPKEFADQVLHMEPHNCGHLGYNDPPNLITKCLNHHRGHPESHHPDVHKANWEERNGKKGAIEQAINEHKEKAQRGEIYWNNTMDGEDRKIAIKRSLDMDKKKGGRRGWWSW